MGNVPVWRLLLVLALVFCALLCDAWVLAEEGDGNVSGPELVWKLYEPAPVCTARGIFQWGWWLLHSHREDDPDLEGRS